MRILSAMLLVPALAGAALSQSAPQPAAESRLPRVQPVEPTAFQRLPASAPVERVRIPVLVPSLPPLPSVDAVFQPAPQGLIDAPSAAKYRRFIIKALSAGARDCPVCREGVAHPAAAAAPWKPLPADARITRTIQLKNASCVEVHRNLQAKCAVHSCLSLAGHEACAVVKPIIVPEPKTNCLLVIGTASQIEKLQAAVNQAETKTDQFEFEIVVSRVLPDGKRIYVARPQLVVTRGREGRMEIAQGAGNVIRMSVLVAPVARAGYVRVFPRPLVAANNDRCFDGRITLIPPPAPAADDAPADRTAHRSTPIRTAAHIAVKRPPRDGEPAVPVQRLRLEVRSYSVKDVCPNGTRQDVEALATVIRMTVAPETWADLGGESAIRYFGSTGSLIIRQTPQAHERISELLNQLRAIRKSR